MTETLFSRAPISTLKFAIARDADWRDSFPKIIDGDGAIDMSLFDRIYRLVIRPQFDHATLTAQYLTVSNPLSTGIYVDPDDVDQIAQIFVPQATVASTFAAGTYDQFLLLEDGSEGFITEIWRGPLYVYPGNRGV